MSRRKSWARLIRRIYEVDSRPMVSILTTKSRRRRRCAKARGRWYRADRFDHL